MLYIPFINAFLIYFELYNDQPKKREISKIAFNDNGSRDDGKRTRSFYFIYRKNF